MLTGLYQEARALLAPLSPGEEIPLRLDEEGRALLSALPRRLAGRGLSCPLPSLPEGSSFSGLREERGMLVFPISHRWYREALTALSAGPWEAPPLERGITQNGGENGPFLLSYAARRCWAICQRPAGDETPGELPPEAERLVLSLLRGGDREGLARRWFRLPPALRQDRLLAGVLGRAFTKSSPT